MSIDGLPDNQTIQNKASVRETDNADVEKAEDDEGGFGSVLSSVADGALAGIAEVAPALPGGELVGEAAEGLQKLKGSAPEPMPEAGDDQIEEMFEMQEQSQAFNLQYLELQQQMQEDNRRFKTMSNLMKTRHDTAKSAINNMRA